MIGLLVAASFVDGGVQAALWVAAILVDWGVSPTVRRRRMATGASALRRTAQPRDHPRSRRVDRGARRRRRGRPHRVRDRRSRARDGAGIGAVVDLLRRRRPGDRTTPDAGGRGSRAQHAGSGLVLLPALPDGGRDRARRPRARGDAGARRRTARRRARVRAARRDGDLSPRPRRVAPPQRATRSTSSASPWPCCCSR